MADKLITIQEAADILGTSEEEIRDLAAHDKIPHYLVGGKFLRFKAEEISAVKDSLAVGIEIESKQPSLGEKLHDFVYFYDYYIASFLIAAAILGVVIWGITH